MFETVKNRRTIRKYLPKDIAPDLLNDLLETSFRASTMGGMQLYSVIVTRDTEMKEKLSPAHFNQPMVKNAPVVLTFCADFRRFCKWCEQRKAVPGYDNLMSFMNAAMDTLLVAQTFCTLAEEAGLGICYLGTTTYNPQMIIDTLQLPELVFPLTTITVGYRTVSLHKLTVYLWKRLYIRKPIMTTHPKILINCMPIRNRCLKINNSSKRIRKKRLLRFLQTYVIQRKIMNLCPITC